MMAAGDPITPFLHRAGWADAARLPVSGDASARRYTRLTAPTGATALLMESPQDDLTPFVRVAAHLRATGFSAPGIFARDIPNGLALIEDFGDGLFAALVARDPARQDSLYAAATDTLVALHGTAPLALPPCDADWLVSMTAPVFDFYADAPQAMAAFAPLFAPLAGEVAAGPPVTVLRDFHAENLIWLPDRTGVARVGLLDFQDALAGPAAYDLVSVLQDARRDVPAPLARAMIDRYVACTGTDAGGFARAFAILGLQRNLRILGIFARLCLRDGKPGYVALIPRVWDHVQRNLDHPCLAPLRGLLHKTLPVPDPAFLGDLRARCATRPPTPTRPAP